MVGCLQKDQILEMCNLHFQRPRVFEQVTMYLNQADFERMQLEESDRVLSLKHDYERKLDEHYESTRGRARVLSDELRGKQKQLQSLEMGSAHCALKEMQCVFTRISELEACLEYVLQAVHANEVIRLIETQSGDLSTIGMALDAFEQLCQLSADCRHVHLRAQLRASFECYREQMKADFKVWLGQVALEKCQWPQEEYKSEENYALIFHCCQSYCLFERMIDQFPGNCMSGLVKPIAGYFHFHFSTDRPTNRLEHPEWAFQFLLSQLRQHEEFLKDLSEAVGADCLHPFIANLVQVAGERLSKLREAVCENTLLPMYIEQIVLFTDELNCSYGFKDATLLDLFLSDERELQKWLEMERARTLDKYEDIHINWAAPDNLLDFLQGHFGILVAH